MRLSRSRWRITATRFRPRRLAHSAAGHLNLGVRWEYVAPSLLSNNVLGNFNVNSPSGLVQETGGGTPSIIFPKDLFSPRIGMAWDVTGKGTTVVRIGGSYMHDFLVFQNLLPNLQQFPTGFALYTANGEPGDATAGHQSSRHDFNSTNTAMLIGRVHGRLLHSLRTASTASGFACGNGLSGNQTPALCNPAVTQPNGFKPDGIITWNLSVQHAFNNNLSLNLAYVGTHGEDLRGTTDINQPGLGLNSTTGTTVTGGELANENLRRLFTENCPATVSGGLGLNPAQCFPYLSQILVQLPNEISNYNALQVNLTQRVSHGLQFNLGYTFAHALDEASGLSNSGDTNLKNTQNPLNNYGNASFDARHHLTVTATYDIPSVKAPAQLLTGWQVNGTETVLSALPFNAYDGTDDLSGTGIKQDRWNIFGNPSNFTAGTATPIPCYGLATSKTFTPANGCITVAPGTVPSASSIFCFQFPVSVCCRSCRRLLTTPRFGPQRQQHLRRTGHSRLLLTGRHCNRPRSSWHLWRHGP